MEGAILQGTTWKRILPLLPFRVGEQHRLNLTISNTGDQNMIINTFNAPMDGICSVTPLLGTEISVGESVNIEIFVSNDLPTEFRSTIIFADNLGGNYEIIVCGSTYDERPAKERTEAKRLAVTAFEAKLEKERVEDEKAAALCPKTEEEYFVLAEKIGNQIKPFSLAALPSDKYPICLVLTSPDERGCCIVQVGAKLTIEVPWNVIDLRYTDAEARRILEKHNNDLVKATNEICGPSFRARPTLRISQPVMHRVWPILCRPRTKLPSMMWLAIAGTNGYSQYITTRWSDSNFHAVVVDLTMAYPEISREMINFFAEFATPVGFAMPPPVANEAQKGKASASAGAQVEVSAPVACEDHKRKASPPAAVAQASPIVESTERGAKKLKAESAKPIGAEGIVSGPVVCNDRKRKASSPEEPPPRNDIPAARDAKQYQLKVKVAKACGGGRGDKNSRQA